MKLLLLWTYCLWSPQILYFHFLSLSITFFYLSILSILKYIHWTLYFSLSNVNTHARARARIHMFCLSFFPFDHSRMQSPRYTFSNEHTQLLFVSHFLQLTYFPSLFLSLSYTQVHTRRFSLVQSLYSFSLFSYINLLHFLETLKTPSEKRDKICIFKEKEKISKILTKSKIFKEEITWTSQKL